MCYYNGVKVTKPELIRLLQLEKLIANIQEINTDFNQGPLYNEPYPVIRATEAKDDFVVERMEWGFLPPGNAWPFLKTREDVNKFRFGYKDGTGTFIPGLTTLNAKAENLFINEKGKKSLYADRVMDSRILVLSTGFWEWRHLPEIGKKGQPLKSVRKIPYFIHLKDTSRPFYMAGFSSPFTDKVTGEHVNTFAVPTTVSNHLMSQVHNAKLRMPCILTEELAYEWLFGNLDAARVKEIASFQYPSELMEAYTVAKKPGEQIDPRAPFEYADVPALEVAA
jgi:putative SOS response-associated peptidase YedK